METDIATRLRSLSEPGTSFDDVGGRSILKDAADEIERLIDLVGWASKQWQETHAGLTKATRWIPVEERLPRDNVDVLVRKGRMCGNVTVVAYRCTGNNCWTMSDGDYQEFQDIVVTHWMPLPEPPEVK